MTGGGLETLEWVLTMSTFPRLGLWTIALPHRQSAAGQYEFQNRFLSGQPIVGLAIGD